MGKIHFHAISILITLPQIPLSAGETLHGCFSDPSHTLDAIFIDTISPYVVTSQIILSVRETLLRSLPEPLHCFSMILFDAFPSVFPDDSVYPRLSCLIPFLA